MSISVQLIQISTETLIEVAGIKEISGIYLEDTDVDISVECLTDVNDKKIKLSIKPNNKIIFTPFSFDIQIMAQKIALARLLNGSQIIIVPKSIDENLGDTQAIKELLQSQGGIWIAGLPRETIREMVKYCTC
ncbi:MAG: hypothetical protein K0R55_451 [Sporomusa sp.]|jgi:hypothetical protein|nr:hypothetical protein [Sporomusa sp.]